MPDLPRAPGGDLPLLEERPVVREQRDIVLPATTMQAFVGIIQEHQRADVLRAHGLLPATETLIRRSTGMWQDIGSRGNRRRHSHCHWFLCA